jgi:hypothetical protein
VFEPPWITTSDSGLSHDWTHDEFALTRICRDIYAETALLPYSLNCFVFHCHIDRETFMRNRSYIQLQAVRTIGIMNAYIVGAINGTDMGNCHWRCDATLCRQTAPKGPSFSHFRTRAEAPPPMVPFSMTFPKLRKIVIEEGGCDKAKLVEMAQRTGAADWKAFVKMREREEVEVVALPPF